MKTVQNRLSPVESISCVVVRTLQISEKIAPYRSNASSLASAPYYGAQLDPSRYQRRRDDMLSWSLIGHSATHVGDERRHRFFKAKPFTARTEMSKSMLDFGLLLRQSNEIPNQKQLGRMGSL